MIYLDDFFKVGQWYEALKPGKAWNKWFYDEKAKKWFNKGEIVAVKFLLLKIFQIENQDDYNEDKFENIGKFLTSDGQVSFYRLKSAANDLKLLCPK